MKVAHQHGRADCDRIGLLLDTYLDGELAQELRFEVDQGLAQCVRCREHVQVLQALRTSMKRVTEQDGVVSAAFAQRIEQSVAAERQNKPARARPLSTWHWALPTAAAAAAFGVVAVRWDSGPPLLGLSPSIHRGPLPASEIATARRDGSGGNSTPTTNDDSKGAGLAPGSYTTATLADLLLQPDVDDSMSAASVSENHPLPWGNKDQRRGWPAAEPSAASEQAVVAENAWEGTPRTSLERASAEQMLDRLIDYHSAPREPQLTKRNLVRQLERRLGVHIDLPQLEALGAQWRSGSLIPVSGNSRAASLHYDVAKHRMTIYVYDPKRVSVNHTLKPRVVANFPVYVGYRRGYSVASFERRGVGYTLATDLDDRKVTEIATTFR